MWDPGAPLAAAAGLAATRVSAARGGLGTCFPELKKREPTAGSGEPGLHFGSWRKGSGWVPLGAGCREGRRFARSFETLCSWVGKA